MTSDPEFFCFGFSVSHQPMHRNLVHSSKPSWPPSPAPCGLQNSWPLSTRPAARGEFVEHINGSLLTARDENLSR